jgi:hypothetical protein
VEGGYYSAGFTKVGSPSVPSDLRPGPISIVSVLFETFERILHDQLLEHVNGCNLLSDFQSGFRRGHRVTGQGYRGFKVDEG